MTYRIHIVPGEAGRDAAACEVPGHGLLSAVSDKGASMALARIMRDKGCPDGPYEVRVGGSVVPSFAGQSLYNWADKTVSEGQKSGPRAAKYQKFSFGGNE